MRKAVKVYRMLDEIYTTKQQAEQFNPEWLHKEFPTQWYASIDSDNLDHLQAYGNVNMNEVSVTLYTTLQAATDDVAEWNM